MPVRSVINQYRGINAHLHSLYQAEGGWSGFHTIHIGDLGKTLTAQLRSMGYTVAVEESLQIRRIGGDSGKPEADLLIYDSHPERWFRFSDTAASDNPIPIGELLAEDDLSEKPYRSLVIYDVKAGSRDRGEPVAWIELLSPANKGWGTDAQIYRSKRMNIMLSGLVFIEIDYLHETPATFSTIPDYSQTKQRPQHPKAHPYRIIILDPRPQLEDGRAWVGSFDVDSLIPTMEIPLNDGDSLKFDFGTAYRKTFEEGFLGDQVDYSELPVNFNRYNSADQTRIAARMLSVLTAQREGVDLEKGNFPIENLSLEQALSKLEDFQQHK